MTPRPGLDLLDRLTRRAASVRLDAEAVRRSVDTAVAAAVSTGILAGAHDPVAVVRFLEESWEPRSLDVVAHGTLPHARAEDAVARLQEGLLPLSFDHACALARAVDTLQDRREEFVRPTYATDIGTHARRSSSTPRKLRILVTLARALRPTHVLEVGTAYGVATRALAEACPLTKITTVEPSQPQLSVATEALAGYGDRVHLVAGTLSDALTGQLSAGLGAFDFVFHDGEHSAAAYERDFAALRPSLAPAAAVLFDDIRWEDSLVSPEPARTYDGWQAVVSTASVAAHVELDRELGLLFLG